MPGEHAPDADAEAQLKVDPDQVHLVVTTAELDVGANALRSVGNIEQACRLEKILHQLTRLHDMGETPEPGRYGG